jgi:hypothetical protein
LAKAIENQFVKSLLRGGFFDMTARIFFCRRKLNCFHMSTTTTTPHISMDLFALRQFGARDESKNTTPINCSPVEFESKVNQVS